MARNCSNHLLTKAKINKKDEFYTRLEDVENELKYYEGHFKNKTIFCNCDNPKKSSFFRYFVLNFKNLQLKRVICAYYVNSQRTATNNSLNSHGKYYIYTGMENPEPSEEEMLSFRGDGDFRNCESIELLKQSDIVVTNPPFSLLREFMSMLFTNKKQFIVMGNIHAITYKEIYNGIKDGKVWLGVNYGRKISGFFVPKDYELYGTETRVDSEGNRIVSTNNCLWLTNLEHNKRPDFLTLTKGYKGREVYYKKYDNYNGINVDKTCDIPYDYFGVMGVPVTFILKYNPDQFEIVSFKKGDDGKNLVIDGKQPYFRILIKRRGLHTSVCPSGR